MSSGECVYVGLVCEAEKSQPQPESDHLYTQIISESLQVCHHDDDIVKMEQLTHNESVSSDCVEAYTSWSIINTVLASVCLQLALICAIPGLLFSLKSRKNYYAGDLGGARRSAANSRILNIIANVFMIIAILASIVYLIFTLTNE